MKSILFPVPLRHFPGARWTRISLRTWHLLSMGYMLGGTAAGVPLADQPVALWGTVLSGALFILLELYTSFVFLLQLKGWAVIAKMLLFGAAVAAPEHVVPYFVAAVIIGGISSHMPGRFRYYSIFHGRVVKE